MVKLLTLLLALVCVAASQLGFANESPDPREKDTDIDANNQRIKFFGYVDGSYNYLVRSPYFTSGAFNRLNDTAQNGARLQQLYLSAESNQPGFGGFINVVVGSDAFTLAPLGWNPAVFNLKNVGLMVPEAYVQYFAQRTTFLVGEIMSVAGIESYIYTEDGNFSRGILNAYAQPGNHLGMRVTQSFSNVWSAFVGVGNGWGTVHHAGQFGALEFGVMGAQDNSFNVTIDGLITPVYLTDIFTVGRQGMRYMLDVYGTYQITDPLSLGLNVDVVTQTETLLPTGEIRNASCAGLGGYLNYQWTDRWRTALRGEIFNDPEGFRTGVRQNWKEVTLTLGYVPIKNLSVMLETRHDFSNVDAFVNLRGIGTNNNQQSYALNMLYQFT